MASYLITPVKAGPWRVDVALLSDWLADRWPGTERSNGGSSHRAYVWTLPNTFELWLPADREVLWVEADATTIAATAAWCSANSPVDLIVTDEGYSHPVELRGLDQAAVLAALDG